MKVFKEANYTEEIRVYLCMSCVLVHIIYIYYLHGRSYIDDESHEENIRPNRLTMTHSSPKQPLRTRPLFV